MHQNRRRKKRPSYGVRTVEISRSRSGFGFTISGQAPCILSCIVSCSPAEQVGLRPGDYLIAVNGQNVSKAPHDDVVRLIGNSSGFLKLQIAENYYSDSSEDEIIAVSRSKLKYPNRARTKGHHVNRAERVVQDLQAGLLFELGANKQGDTNTQKSYDEKKIDNSQLAVRTTMPNKHTSLQQFLKDRPRAVLLNVHHDNVSVNSKHHSKKRERKNIAEQSTLSGKENLCSRYFTEQELNDVLYPSLQLRSWDVYLEEAIYRAVVGYLGTIEMPKEPQIPGSRLHDVRKCIRRLRIEKKVHTLVLLTVFFEKITLTNPHGLTIAEYPAEKISFSGVYGEDKKFFGIVTSQGGSFDEESEESQDDLNMSSSCHVFMIDPRMISHDAHANRAKMFSLECDHNPQVKCPEFPDSADPILRAILSVYRNRSDGHVALASGLVDMDAAVMPRHSNTSSNSSNSDSGIGFRDEAQHSDQVFVVDVDPSQRIQFSNVPTNRYLPSVSSAPKKDKPQSKVSESSVPSTAAGVNETGNLDRLTVRVMPNPVGFAIQDASCSKRKNLRKNQRKKANSGVCDGVEKTQKVYQLPSGGLNIRPAKADGSLTASLPKEQQLRKLSPKVYNVEFPTKPLVPPNLPTQSIVEGLPSSLHCDVDSPDILTDATENTAEQEGSQDVHPPTQDEESEGSDLENANQNYQANKRWMRTSSLRQQFSKGVVPQGSNESGALSDGELVSGKLSTCSSLLGFEDIGMEGSTQGRASGASGSSLYGSECNFSKNRVAGWAISFDKLLQDPVGVHTLAMFLKKEFSHENIYFWVASERYRKYATGEEMKVKACEIFKRHLCLGAAEPVNVDSHARQLAQEGLDNPTSEIFVQAQKQIYNLMKFDCYSRFLKSPLYKECVMAEISGSNLPFSGDDDLDPGLPYWAAEKSMPKNNEKDEADERRRKSLLPWHRKSSKNKDGKGFGKNGELRKSGRRADKDQRSEAEASGSRASLVSSDLVAMQRQTASKESLSASDSLKSSTKGVKPGSSLCRVILPDQSTTVMQTRSGSSVYAMLQGLLEKRGLQYSAIEVFIANSGQAVEMSEDSCVLDCCEILVEQRILFCLDLPQCKTIAVRARPTSNLGHVLHPILQRYGTKMDAVTLFEVGSAKPVDLSRKAESVDKQRLVVQFKEDYAECGPDIRLQQFRGIQLRRTRCPSDDLTDAASTDWMLTKSNLRYDDLGVLDLDLVASAPKTDEKSSRASGFFGLVRRNSVHFDRDVSKRAKTKGVPGHRASVHEGINHHLPETEKPPVSRRTITGRNENDELFAIWKRAERSRLDDQRGTEINFELPDFLKPKIPLDGRASEPLPVRHRYGVYDESWTNPTIPDSNHEEILQGLPLCNQSFSVGSIIPTQQQAEELFSSACHQARSPTRRDSKMPEISLKDIGFEYHSRAEAPFRLVQPKTLPPRPSSHPLPRFSSQSNTHQIVAFPSEQSSVLLTSKLSGNRAGSASLNSGLDASQTVAKLASREPLPSVKYIDSANLDGSAFRQTAAYSSCRQSVLETPPPLPPKPKLPPPRGLSLAAPHLTAVTRKSAEEKGLQESATANFMSSSHINQNKRPDLLSQTSVSQKGIHADYGGSGNFSISFV